LLLIAHSNTAPKLGHLKLQQQSAAIAKASEENTVQAQQPKDTAHRALQSEDWSRDVSLLL
jgi:hypothetical protein